jgi:predicted outer membrane repeat protein
MHNHTIQNRARCQHQSFGRRFIAATLAALVFVLGGPLWARAATFTVTSLNNAGPGSLRRAILNANAAPGADIITFAPGLSGTIVLTTGQLTVTDDLTIDGPGAAQLAVSGNSSSRVFRIASVPTVTIRGLTITQGLSFDEDGGGGVLNLGTLTIDRCVVRENSASFDSASKGGGISNFGSLTVSESTIDKNSADGGGGIWNSGTLAITGSRIIENGTADDSGGGIFNLGGQVIVTDSIIRANSAVDNGGGIFNRGTLTIRTTIISQNVAVFLDGGGIYSDGSASIVGSRIGANSANLGGGIFNVRSAPPFPSEGLLRIVNTRVEGNRFGGIHNDSGVVEVLSNSRVANNTGSGIVNAVANQLMPATLTVRSSTVSGNTYDGNGGGIFNEATDSLEGTVNLISASVSGNTAVSGGGVYNQGLLFLTSGSHITMNTATGGVGSGGGVFLDGGSVTLDATSTVSGNTPDDFAGG